MRWTDESRKRAARIELRIGFPVPAGQGRAKHLHFLEKLRQIVTIVKRRRRSVDATDTGALPWDGQQSVHA